MMEKQDYEHGSIQELLACLVWHRQKTVFAKSIASVLLSNVNPEKAGEKYEEVLVEMYPQMKEEKQLKEDSKRRYLEATRGKKIFIKDMSNA